MDRPLDILKPRTTPDLQSEVVIFLDTPQSYPDVPENVRHIETHGAHIFLAGDRAIKIKRDIKLPYLDYSTLEKRAEMCRREFELNRRTAPEIYRGVIAITRDAEGRLAIDGAGEIVEWALEMNRFDEDQLFSNLAREGAISPPLAKRLADRIEAYHAGLAPVPFVDSGQMFHDLIDQLTNAFKAGHAILGRNADSFERAALDSLLKAEHCLGLRARRGFVRRCHGDLHLANIVRIDDQPVLFDAIEFDDRLATIDVLYDLAFTLMDLLRFGLDAEANLVLNRYLNRSDDATTLYGLQALPLFLGCRAAVRAMVSLDRCRVAEADSGAVNEAQKFFARALDLLQPPAPRLVAIGGLSGSGKTTVAGALAPSIGPAPGAVHLRTDLERKSMLNVDELEKLPSEYYSQVYSNRVYDILCRKAAVGLTAGHSVIVDAVFSSPAERDATEQVAKRVGVAFHGIWLTSTPDALRHRVAARSGDASDATPEVVDLQLKKGTGSIAWNLVDASGSPDQVCDRAARLVTT